MVGIRGTFSTPSVSSFIVNQKDGERDVCLQDIPDIQVLRKEQEFAKYILLVWKTFHFSAISTTG